MISLRQSKEELDLALRREFNEGIGIVLDYLWGKSAEQIIAVKVAKGSKSISERCRFVQIGSLSGADNTLPSAALRSSGLELLGSGHGSLSTQGMLNAIQAVASVIVTRKLLVEAKAVPLSWVEATWNEDAEGSRVVYTI
jgi:hypothetical protein